MASPTSPKFKRSTSLTLVKFSGPPVTVLLGFSRSECSPPECLLPENHGGTADPETAWAPEFWTAMLTPLVPDVPSGSSLAAGDGEMRGSEALPTGMAAVLAGPAAGAGACCVPLMSTTLAAGCGCSKAATGADGTARGCAGCDCCVATRVGDAEGSGAPKQQNAITDASLVCAQRLACP
jgi:hypothetical protein